MARNTYVQMSKEYGYADTTLKDAVEGRYVPVSMSEDTVKEIRGRRQQYAKDLTISRQGSKLTLKRDFKIGQHTLDKYLRTPKKRKVPPVERFMTMKLTSNPQPSCYYHVFSHCG